MEIAGRAGGLVPSNRITPARPRPVRRPGRRACSTASWNAIRRSPTGSTSWRRAAPQDVFVLVSSPGINGAVVELAHDGQGARPPLIAMTSVEHSSQMTPRHPSGRDCRHGRRRAGQRRAVRGRMLRTAGRRRLRRRSRRSPRACSRRWWSPRSVADARGARARRRPSTCPPTSPAGDEHNQALEAGTPGGSDAEHDPNQGVRNHVRTTESPSQPIALSRRTVLRERRAAWSQPAAARSPRARPRPRRRRPRAAAPVATSATNPLGVPTDKPLEVVDLQRRLRRRVRQGHPPAAVQDGVPEGRRSSTTPPGDHQGPASRGSPAATRRTFVNNSGAKRWTSARSSQRRPAPGPDRAVRRAVAGRPGQEGQGHPRPRHHRHGTYNGKPYVLNYVSPSSASGTPAKLFKDNGWTRAEDLGASSPRSATDQGQGHHPLRLRRANASYYQYELHPHHRREDRRRGRPEEHRQPRGRRLEDRRGQAGRRRRGPRSAPSTSTRRTAVSSTPRSRLQQNQYKVGHATRRVPGWRTSRAKDTPAGFEYGMAAIPDGHRLRQAAVDGTLRARPARTTSSRPRARTRRAAWSTCGHMLSRRRRGDFTELVRR